MNIKKINGTEIVSDKSTLREAVEENKASLFGSDLTGVELHYANLSLTNFFEANLERANLLGANLE